MQKAPLAECDTCPLRHEKFVPTVGPDNPTYLIIGEAPGLQETLRGRPFVGKSGQLLKQAMRGADIDIGRAAFTNTVLCRPPHNEDPDREAIAACSKRLRADIERLSPEIIICAGGISTRAVLGSTDGVLAARIGPPKSHKDYSGRIIPTVHPAFVLRSPTNYAYLETDLRKATLRPTAWKAPRYFVPTSVRTTIRCLEAIKRMNRPIAIDIEVAIDKETDFEHPSNYDLLCLGIAFDEDHAIVIGADLLLDAQVGWAIRNLLLNTPILAQNGKFDLPGLGAFGEFSLSDDTLLASYALDERPGTHSLDYLGREFLGAPDWKGAIAPYKHGPEGFGGIPPHILHKYNAYDCALTYRLHTLLIQSVDDQGLRPLYEFLVRSSNALMKVEEQGLLIDQAYHAELDEKYSKLLAEQETKLTRWVENPRSWQQIQRALIALGIKTESTDADHLQQILDAVRDLLEQSPQEGVAVRAMEVEAFIDGLLTYRHDQKRYGTYIAGVKSRLYRGRIYPSYLLHGTRTGRLSSRNPNIQNIPRGSEIRRMFISDPGCVFIQADYAQGELRLVTTLSQCEYFTTLFRDTNADPIGNVQLELFGPPSSDYELNKQQRTRTKNIVYGSLYGMIMGRGRQGKLYARKLHMTDDEAFRYQRALFDLAPEIEQWQNATRKKFLEGEPLQTVFGRRLRIPVEVLALDEKSRIDALNECLAFIPQSTLSDICLHALCGLVEAGENIVISIHDALIAQCRAGDSDLVAHILTAAMERSARDTFSNYIQFPVETSVATNWGDLG